MFVKDITVKNQVGLHARPATFFIQKANEFKSSIWVEKEERRVNAKSLLGVLSLGIVGNTSIRIIADGVDEKEAVTALEDLINSGFDYVSKNQSHQAKTYGGTAFRTDGPVSSVYPKDNRVDPVSSFAGDNGNPSVVR